MEEKKIIPAKDLILNTLTEKSVVKQVIYDQTIEAFGLLKEVLHEIALDLNGTLKGTDRRIRLEYVDRGKFEAELKVAGDILIFSMHIILIKKFAPAK